MIDIGEAQVLGKQMAKELIGKKIAQVSFGNSPHRFAFFSATEEVYEEWLLNQTIQEVNVYGNFVVLALHKCALSFSEGLNFYWLAPTQKLPKKYQFALTFSDDWVLACSVSMYGAMMLQTAELVGNEYFQVAQEKPNPLATEFNEEYFEELRKSAKPTLSLKAFMGTEQRIPGLGNGSLHDIFFSAQLLPKRKLATLNDAEFTDLFTGMKTVLKGIVAGGGRDTEKDFYGQKGGYQTILSSKTWKSPCPRCGHQVSKESYLGGTIYYCSGCQK
ncbi:hypothetical protein [Enterococcus sp. LJL90]